MDRLRIAVLVGALGAALLPGLASAQTYTRTDVIVYHDNTSKWVLGQVASSTNSNTGLVEYATTYDATTALPLQTYAFGKLQQTLTYNANGNVVTVKDGNSNVTTLSAWKRGIPGSIKHPVTPESPLGAVQSADIDNNGWITSVTDETNSKTCYEYDPMGRVTQIIYPSDTQAGVCDTSKWGATTISFAPQSTGASGLPAGYWRQDIATGNYRKHVYHDALWRPVVIREHDQSQISETTRFTRFAYDHEGRTTFASYPGAVHNLTNGAWTSYDALGRVRSVKQDWEGAGQLTTTTSYLSNAAGSYTLVTDPRGGQTRTWYQAFDQPSHDYPVTIWHPAGAYTHIDRDVFGKPKQLRRSNNSSASGGTLAVNRSYAYNTAQELCRTVEPETGATLMGYDGAGNLTWSASGLPAATACHATGNLAVINARKATRAYDARNRVASLGFPDGLGNTISTYTPDGLLASITADNGGSSQVTTNYTYNRRRLMIGERMLWGSVDWPIQYTYNANGHLASKGSYGGFQVAYAPNALGQPTQAGTYATGVKYFPNGAMKEFSYGNGLRHTLTQNARGLPDTSCDYYGTCNASAVLNDGYDYDGNANVAAISDGRTGNRGNRTMTYDALDRLTGTVSPMFGTASYTYDVLDNLTRVQVGATSNLAARNHHYCYDGAWRLTNVKTGSCAGATVVGLGYDLQGNVTNKNGAVYVFDYGNRLRGSNGVASYVYDGHGRRARDYTTASKYSQYANDGQLSFVSDLRAKLQSWYVHLNGSLVAIRERDTVSGAAVVKYQHTDALGSPVAITDASRVVVERSEYEPYGRVGNRAARDGVGYTGHVEDAATGLTYMQQRYYDPQIGLFLSVDPVTAYSNPVGQFHRYRYANNNPYKFVDPDGRAIVIPWKVVGDVAVRRGTQAGIASQLDSPLPGPGDVVGAIILAGAIGEIGYKIYQANQEQSPTDVVNDVIEGILEGTTPAPGTAGERGERQGGAGDGDAAWEKLNGIPGAQSNGPNNIKFPDGSNANRHTSTRPYKDGPPAGTDTIKHYPKDSNVPSTTIRYPKGSR
ncbi:RHS repeat domain-containing protein [Luteimonas sp. RIT-PG2_3]